jgi:succinate dehydrogenase/fumarate reductase flavoprotein subunit
MPLAQKLEEIKVKTQAQLGKSWDLETDVVVIGFGLAGGISAIEAVDKGLDVLVLEKMPNPGGISICSGGGVRTATNFKSAFQYLQATCGGTTPDAVLKVFAQGMVDVRSYMEKLAVVNNTELATIDYPGNYPFPGYQDLGFSMYGKIPGLDYGQYYPQALGMRGGKRHFKTIEDNVIQRGVRVMTETPAQRLVTDEHNQVVGVLASRGGNRLLVRARKGVILSCGGFEANEEMKRQYIANIPIVSAAFRGNTGDGIKMAQKVGAALWHMNSIHGTYGFLHTDPSYPFGLRTARLTDWSPVVPLQHNFNMCWIIVDQNGRRFMDEYPPYLQDTGHLGMLHLDTVTQTYPRVPSYLVFDEMGRKCYPLSMPAYNENGIDYQWSEDNLKEVESGILIRTNTIDGLAAKIGVDSEVLEKTLEHWNQGCARRIDEDFGRRPETMMPISTPPYYYGQVWPIVSNTQGGPVHNEHWQVLDAFSDPIPGLYEAGECGGIWGHLYLAAGNLAECYIGAWSAVKHMAGVLD